MATKSLNTKLLLIILFLLAAGIAPSTGQVAVIAHKQVPADSIEKSKLVDIYTGDIKRWNDDLAVVVFDLRPKNDIKKRFYDFLGKSTSRMKSIWLKKMLSGEGDPPESLKSEEQILKKVASTPGAIGFVREEMVSNRVKKILVIN